MIRRSRAMFLAILALLVAVPATASADIFWTDPGGNRLSRAHSDGTDPLPGFITGAQRPGSLALRDGWLYWVNLGADSIGRARVDGSAVTQGFVTGLSDPRAIAVSGGHLYWTEPGNDRIGRVRVDGGGVERSFIKGATGSRPTGIAASEYDLFWGNVGTGTIGVAKLDGTGVNQSLITGVDTPVALAANSAYLYWISGTSTATTIGRAFATGGDVRRAYRSLGTAADALAVDQGSLYWSQATTGRITRVPFDESLPDRTLLTSGGSVLGLASDLQPLVTGVWPRSGTTAGGVPVAVHVSGAYGVPTITLGGVPCTNVRQTMLDVYSCVTGARAAGAGDVLLINPDGRSATLPGAFTYSSSLNSQAQVPRHSCVRVPTRLRMDRVQRLLRPDCETNTGQPVKVTVKRLKGKAECRRVLRRADDAVDLRINCKPIKVRIVWRARGRVVQPFASYLPYKHAQTYRLPGGR